MYTVFSSTLFSFYRKRKLWWIADMISLVQKHIEKLYADEWLMHSTIIFFLYASNYMLTSWPLHVCSQQLQGSQMPECHCCHGKVLWKQQIIWIHLLLRIFEGKCKIWQKEELCNCGVTDGDITFFVRWRNIRCLYRRHAQGVCSYSRQLICTEISGFLSYGSVCCRITFVNLTCTGIHQMQIMQWSGGLLCVSTISIATLISVNEKKEPLNALQFPANTLQACLCFMTIFSQKMCTGIVVISAWE